MSALAQYLVQNLFEEPNYAPTRDGFGQGLLELGEKDPRVVALCADLSESTRMLAFKEKYPERFIQVGVAEQNLATIASGLANYGKIPFIASYAAFSPGRNNEQIRTTISLNNVPVKIVGSHAGLSVGPDGATHQALEDIALMRVQPNMTVISPCDKEEARKATLAAAAHPGPVYIRLAREKTPVITTADTPFQIGKATELWQGNNPQVAVFVTGPLAHNALLAAQALASEISVTVINIHTIKPIDEAAVISFAKQAGSVVTVEEHQIAGGLGSAVAEVLARNYPVPIEFIGVHDRFGQSGEGVELWREYKLDASSIQAAIRTVFARKLT
ncbi:transketolase [Candidatus Adlerbacteria bacterium RIFOXYC1_FULL_48_26]|uniref:Transketolase n=1 Tax=Candidatus Adlerbacteria bacterium RIFOXYC1_FULL_48_26 TaxID=1797247 RepID=A0A1F4Y403_9BACT|nr:MAG: transketolase [Candidatus Adlerbacteria bacterium RIFOXYC1_FULL_48_26]OGC93914.1 MAG: transketolase [Candidatus Adlerbacteria bacterium RIFOXYB1_FULL_48_10]OGC95890.1 MAG: transketolase [Candidatus Adlerbacteria bacterium RIFOXYD1_FULL_48_8]